ncbi:hypothetical protein MMC08_008426, partial [Hypocenomyce scalaris]|nr:hypothetical protein [Hypocenomyce scalaris]
TMGKGTGRLRTIIPTLPPRRKTDPGKLSPLSFEISAFSFTNPRRPPPKKSTDWISILRSWYGDEWKV